MTGLRILWNPNITSWVGQGTTNVLCLKHGVIKQSIKTRAREKCAERTENSDNYIEKGDSLMNKEIT